MQIPKYFIRYCLVGIVNTITGIFTAYICLNLLRCSYLVSASAAYVTGIIVSFILNKIFTFHDENKNYILQFFKFVISMLPSYAVSYFSGWKISKIFFTLPHTIDYAQNAADYLNMTVNKFTDNIAILISMVIYLILGFSINKFLIFTKKNESK